MGLKTKIITEKQCLLSRSGKVSDLCEPRGFLVVQVWERCRGVRKRRGSHVRNLLKWFGRESKMGAHFKKEAKAAYSNMVNWRAQTFPYGWIGRLSKGGQWEVWPTQL